MLFQENNLFSHLTVAQNIGLGLNPGLKLNSAQQEKMHAIARQMGIDNLMARFPGELSGGQRQALTLLMATLQKPKLLLLDEHTAALDPKTAAKVLETTERIIQRDHLTTLMITHNMQQSLEMGNRTIMMDEGRIVLDLKGEERAGMTVEDLIERFRAGTGRTLDNDRMLLSE